jgi:hypothetical protein
MLHEALSLRQEEQIFALCGVLQWFVLGVEY